MCLALCLTSPIFGGEPHATRSRFAAEDPPSEPPTIRIAAVGDLLFDRGVREAIAAHGVDWLFDDVKNVLEDADLAVGNLECPLSRRGLRSAKPFSFRGDPECAAALARAGFDVLTLANNHSLDFGRAALSDTISALVESKITPVGAGRSGREASRATIVEVKGLRIAFVAYCDLFVEGTTPRDDAVGISTGDEQRLLNAIREARTRSDVVIALVHWGAEYKQRPTQRQRDLAAQCLEAGAAAVVGAHPHVLQPVAFKNNTLVAYSLGNFVFDHRKPPSSDSAILLLSISARGVEAVDCVPVVLLDSRPRKASSVQQSAIKLQLGLSE